MSITADAFESAAQPARRWLANSLRDKVAGEDAEANARAIWMVDGERWFNQGDPIWRVHDDASMFVGGIRALLLQSLHPLAMAGVAGHSGYRSDPWGRLQRTSTYLAATTFGTVATAEASIARVRSIHERVRGRAEDGGRYAADDPHLLGWVHVAEADSFLASYRRFGGSRLTPAEEDRYVEQSGSIAVRLGVVDPPTTVAELREALDAYRPELVGSPAALEAARYLLLHPPIGWSERAGYSALAAGAVALLPIWAKEMLRLPVLPITERLVGAPLGDAAVRAIRWALSDPRHPRNTLRKQTT
ncbi:oxygenase MpaB family protein [Lapillicoccus sp.]|uniref:oxygenase MpaB family protein n=1 Tax=Lapillicoccus sp. TaxID=1909287 RepID=UPI00326496F1